MKIWLKQISVILGLALLIGGGTAYWRYGADYYPILPVQTVKVTGYYQHINERQLEDMLVGYMAKGFLWVDIDGIKNTIESLPWVDQVIVKRVWPETIVIEITEQVPVAWWGTKGLLNNKGTIFKPEGAVEVKDLPVLNGPAAQQKFVMENYHLMNRILRLAGLKIQSLHLLERLAWEVSLDNGIHLKLGQNWSIKQLSQFLWIYTNILSKDTRKIQSIDLRYSYGLAVAWS